MLRGDLFVLATLIDTKVLSFGPLHNRHQFSINSGPHNLVPGHKRVRRKDRRGVRTSPPRPTLLDSNMPVGLCCQVMCQSLLGYGRSCASLWLFRSVLGFGGTANWPVRKYYRVVLEKFLIVRAFNESPTSACSWLD